MRQCAGPLWALYAKWLGDQWSVGDWEGLLRAAPNELPAWAAGLLFGRTADAPAGPPQNLREYDPEWGHAFWTGTVTANCDHARMIAAARVPVLFTHHFRTTDPGTGHLIGAIADEQAEQVRRLVAEAGQPFEYRSFPEQPHAMHQADPPLYARTVIDWAASVLAENAEENAMPIVEALPEHVTVLIVGGGPVGLSCAVELAHHGVPSLVLERRPEVSHLRPRAKTTSARTMEHFRRWGIAEEIRRRAGLPVEWSDAAVFCTALTGREITRITGCFGLDLTGSELVAEAGQQVAQPVVEEVLREKLAASDVAGLALGVQAVAAGQDDDGAWVDVIDRRTAPRGASPPTGSSAAKARAASSGKPCTRATTSSTKAGPTSASSSGRPGWPISCRTGRPCTTGCSRPPSPA